MGTQRPVRPDYIWRAVLDGCVVECYDFQLYKISDPPPVDYDTPVIGMRNYSTVCV